MRLKIKGFLCGDVKNLSADRHGYRPHFSRGVSVVLDTRLYGALLLVIALIILMSGCSGTFLDISAGPQIDPITKGDSHWEGSGPIVDIAIRKQWDQWFCQYAHTSNLGSGPPLNDDRETTLDRVTCGRRFELGQFLKP